MTPASPTEPLGDEDETAGSAIRKDQGGIRRFSPQLSGHAKAFHSHTSSFDSGPPDYTLPGYPSGRCTAAPGQEEGARMRHPATSSVGRVEEE